MNEELEKNFLEEIKPLIDEYLKTTRELENLEIKGRSIVKEIGEQRSQEIRQVIYNKTKRFMDKAKEQSMEDKKKEIEKKAIELKVAENSLKSKYVYSQNTIQLRNMAKAVSNVAYKSADDMLQIAVNELRQANEAYKKVQEEYTKAQELESIELLDEKYRNIDFESEKGIEDIINIIKEQEEKDLSNEPKEREQTINNPRIHETADDIKVASIEELEKRRQGETQEAEEEQENSVLNNDENTQEEEEREQTEDQEERTAFKRINPDEVDIITPPKVLTREDLEAEEGQDNTVLDNEENAVDEEKRKLEEEQMWEEYNKEQEEQEEQAKKETNEKLEEHEQKLAKDREKHDKAEAKFYENLEKEKQEFNEEEEKRLEEEQKIREKKEEFFNNKEKFYEDLLKEDLPYQALKERLINTYKLPQLGKALNKKSLVEIYELYVKQVIKDLENNEIIEEGLTEEELEAKLQEKLDNEELKRTLSVRLEMLKERETRIKEVKQYFKNIEKQYGKDLLPNIYFKDKDRLMNRYIKWSKEIDFDFLQYCEEQFKILEEIANNTEIKAESGEIQDYKDLLEKIEKIRGKKVELEKPQPKPVENAYKETKIVVEPYNDRIMVYLKGEVKPRPYDKLAELMEDGKNLYKSGSNNDGRNLNGSIKGIEIGNYAIIAVLSELGIEKNEDYIEGYTHMFAEKPEKTSKIDSIVYDFTNEGGKIQSQKMIKEMQKYAKEAEKYEVAESIGRKKGIGEKAKSSIGSLLGKGKEKVLALGEGIKGFHPIENAIENKRAKRHSKDLEVDEGNATDTYKKWRRMMGEGAPTQEEQAEFALFKNCEDETREDSRYNREEDEFYSRW